ncbi:RutC family protein YjgH [BD1-7 clade bacterium]|nr:RutC family protein YjgH [BD1-7 clade bacterium]
MNSKKFTPLISVLAIVGALNSPQALADSKQPRKAIHPTQYGFSYANAVIENTAMLYVSGQVGSSKTGPNDFYSQVDRSFENLQSVLKESGASFTDVVKITLLITDYDPDKLAYMVKKRKAVFGDSPPASTLIPVTRLYADGVMFEIDAIAVLPK